MKRGGYSLVAMAILTSFPVMAEPDGEQQSRAISATPIELVRTLQALQDQIAMGSTNAHLAQRTLLARIDESLTSLDATVWQEPHNVRSTVVFVLSGGRPDILRKIQNTGGLATLDEVLVKGALAYVEGREDDARQLLEGIDVHTLPPVLAGQIALVQSALVVRNDPARSVALLDFARLQLPGTLVEEAALRREIFVVSQMGDTKKFDALSRQYLRRFRHSIYSGNFRQRFASALTRLEFAKDHERFRRLVSMLDELEPSVSLELYLMIARAAIEQGQTGAAVLAADKAGELSGKDSVSNARARLYRAAAIVVSKEGFEPGLAELRRIDKQILPPRDVELLDSALAMASFIRSGPAGAPSPVPPPKPVASVEPPEKINLPTPAISRAQSALERVDRLFQKDSR
ncbi:chemotaxis protein MotC [Microvirga flavescens]|uniref:chemotaxis protein MotC n=1 Tax=Microvirga flavescens TaxID=2249811 RepID=UPI0013001DFC|nr:chemotaxis protein MotC [Microvirga flavescens]